MTDSLRPTLVLIADLVGLAFDDNGQPDPSQVRAHIEAQKGCSFVHGPANCPQPGRPDPRRVIFHYCPDVSTREDLLQLAGGGAYDALIAAATFIPAGCRFDLGGVRIGAGTGNMGSNSWGGPGGSGGVAPLMNTPGINSRATAQMVWKALMHALPDLPFATLHERVAAGRFDTGRHLRDFPTCKLEGQKLAVIGYGNIGREVAKLGKAFGMEVAVFARPRHQPWIEAEGLRYAPTPQQAARGAIALSVHLGLGPMDKARGLPENAGLIGEDILSVMATGAVLINFDRGELVDPDALARALSAGRIGRAVIDADIFVDDQTGAASGPMAPYLPLLESFGDRLCLLPHAAADTDHPTRVAGAKQAVDQILSVIRKRVAINAVGDLPDGITQGSASTPPGVGAIAPARLGAVLAGPEGEALEQLVFAIHRRLKEFAASDGAEAQDLMLDLNRLQHLLQRNGLEGPLSGR